MIVIDASAIKSSGGLTILNQLIENIFHLNYNFFLIVNNDYNVYKIKSNLTYFKINQESRIKRVLWNAKYFNECLVKNRLHPSLIINLQNTALYHQFECKQIVYLHQAISFIPFKWSFIKRKNWNLLFYNMFYSYFIFKYTDINTFFVVQSNWLRKILINKKTINEKNIIISKPNGFTRLMNKTLLSSTQKKQIFYPATPFDYKNHIEIIKAVQFIVSHNIPIPDFIISFTFLPRQNKSLYKIIIKNRLEKYFEFLGPISQQKIRIKYQSCDLVVFPSLIESYGLPLIEAASFGKPIITVDEEYAHETLSGYCGATYVKKNDSKGWANAISNALKVKKSFDYFEGENGWNSFIELICKLG